MKRSVVLVILGLALSQGAEAEERQGRSGVRPKDAFPTAATVEMTGWMSLGIMFGLDAVGVKCRQEFVLAELTAFLLYRADRDRPAEEVIRNFLDERGCETGMSQEAKDRAMDVGAKVLAVTLINLRESTDVAFLQGFIEKAEAKRDDPVGTVWGMMAGARLAELQRESQRKHGPPPVIVDR